MTGYRRFIAAVLCVAFESDVTSAGEWVFAPRDQNALRQLNNDGFLALVSNVTASCDYEIKRPMMDYRLDRTSGFELFVSCVRAKGVEVFTPAQYRGFADAWNAKHPELKARGVLRDIAD